MRERRALFCDLYFPLGEILAPLWDCVEAVNCSGDPLFVPTVGEPSAQEVTAARGESLNGAAGRLAGIEPKTAAEAIKAGSYEVVLFGTPTALRTLPMPQRGAFILPWSGFDELLEDAQQAAALASLRPRLRGATFVHLREQGTAYGYQRFPEARHVFLTMPPLLPERYTPHRGGVAAILYAGDARHDGIEQRDAVRRHALGPTPHFLLGDFPDVPNARRPRSWKDWTAALQAYAALLHLPARGMNSAPTYQWWEARLTGTPTLCLTFAGAGLKDGVNCFASNDVGMLRARAGDILAAAEQARAIGQAGRASLLRRLDLEAARQDLRGLLRPEERPASAPARRGGAPAGDRRGEPLRLIWEGTQFVDHSLALVNRRLCAALQRTGECELQILPYEPHEFDARRDPEREGLLAEAMRRGLSGPAHLHVRHQWPPSFERPARGAWVLMQPWEFGSMLRSWQEPLARVDEVWVYSRHNRACYLEDGLEPSRVHVIPLGVDHSRFHPNQEPLPAVAQATRKRVKFLFVGGAIHRKGIDLLLEAYAAAFSRQDDVCLVIKDFGQESFYRGQGAGPSIEALQADAGAPEILYLGSTLSEAEVARLYASCDCLVHPYRGEGFGLPVAEAMASGLPVLVSRGGACDDFCTDAGSYFIPTSRRTLDLREPTVRPAWLLEPDVEALTEILRRVYRNDEERRRKGAAARAHVLSQLSWERSARFVLERLRSLRAAPGRAARRRTAEAANGHRRARRPSPSTLEELRLQAQRQAEAGDLTALQGTLEAILAQQPQDAWALAALGQLFLKQQEPRRARLYLERALAAAPRDADLQTQYGQSLFLDGDVGRAAHHFEQALAINPRHPTAMNNLGMVRWQEGNLGAAGEIFAQVLRLEPAHGDALANLGILAEQSGDLRTAATCYERLLALAPHDQDVRRRLSRVRAGRSPATDPPSAEAAALAAGAPDTPASRRAGEGAPTTVASGVREKVIR
ncbi:MAG: glycosyltransferase [Candidatus Tectomicrobia bacterium]|nr:glycosyltransferase [Candidatus Tectomicrobia bacterium]